MKLLKEIQNEFLETLVDENNLAFLQNIKQSNNIPISVRFEVSRSGIFESLRAALKITYPGTFEIVGEDCASAVAYKFCSSKANLPATGSLDDWGAGFPKFLQECLRSFGLDYLEDYAKLEWLRHLSYVAANNKPPCALALDKLTEQQINSLKFRFSPSVFMLRSKYALDKIDELVRSTDQNLQIEVDNQPSYIIIFRDQDDKIITLWLTLEYFKVISEFYDGLSLQEMTSNNNKEIINEVIYFMHSKKLCYLTIDLEDNI